MSTKRRIGQFLGFAAVGAMAFGLAGCSGGDSGAGAGGEGDLTTIGFVAVGPEGAWRQANETNIEDTFTEEAGYDLKYAPATNGDQKSQIDSFTSFVDEGVDIILLEPEANDELMFGTPIMDYSRRLRIARHGFESVTATLAKDYDRYKEIADRHGLEISGRRVNRVVERAAEEESEQLSAWRRVLEQTTSVLLRQSGEAS